VGRPVGTLIAPDRRHEADEIQNRIRTGGSVKDLDTVRVRAGRQSDPRVDLRLAHP